MPLIKPELNQTNTHISLIALFFYFIFFYYYYMLLGVFLGVLKHTCKIRNIIKLFLEFKLGHLLSTGISNQDMDKTISSFCKVNAAMEVQLILRAKSILEEVSTKMSVVKTTWLFTTLLLKQQQMPALSYCRTFA